VHHRQFGHRSCFGKGKSALCQFSGSEAIVRAESANTPIDYGNAVESFGKALAKSPDDPIALFNRALACEQMFLYTHAVDDWEHYLRVDPHGDWSEETPKRLATLQQKLEQHEQSQAEPLFSPLEIAKAGAGNAVVRHKIDARIEDYLDLAISDWLSKAINRPWKRGCSWMNFERIESEIVGEIRFWAPSDHRDRSLVCISLILRCHAWSKLDAQVIVYI
jgi:tetratricopeptide (TPR) repeat protein